MLLDFERPHLLFVWGSWRLNLFKVLKDCKAQEYKQSGV